MKELLLLMITILSMKPGGFTDNALDINNNQQLLSIVNTLKLDIIQQAGNVDQFIPLNYKSQVVAGVIYLVSIKIGESKYLKVKILEPLPFQNKAPSILECTKTAFPNLEFD